MRLYAAEVIMTLFSMIDVLRQALPLGVPSCRKLLSHWHLQLHVDNIKGPSLYGSGMPAALMTRQTWQGVI